MSYNGWLQTAFNRKFSRLLSTKENDIPKEIGYANWLPNTLDNDSWQLNTEYFKQIGLMLADDKTAFNMIFI